MDTLSHALVGLAVAGLSGHQPSLNDPVFVAAVLGAQAPDFDIIAQIRGNMAYLRQHRAFSHSIPGVAVWSALLATGIMLFMPQAAWVSVFFWAFAGGLSHIILDYFNTHGVAILWPFRKERKSYPLLNVFDPILLLTMLSLYFLHLPMLSISLTTFASLAIYILLRYLMRRRAIAQLNEHFPSHTVVRSWVMPSLKQLMYWDFVIETDQQYYNGRIGSLYPVMEIKADFLKQDLSPLARKASETTLGEFFNLFTPFLYFEEEYPDNVAAKVTIYDLRYFDNRKFIHSATIVFDHGQSPMESYIHSLGRTIKVESYQNT